MRTRHLVVYGIAALATTACTHGVKVTPLARQTSDVSRYATFFMLDGSSSGNADVDRQIRTDLRMALANKGVVETPPEEGQAAVIAHVATPAKHTREAFYAGWEGWRWRGAAPGTTNVGDNYDVGTLVVDMFDVGTRQLVWQGSASHAVPAGPTRHPHATQHAVARMFRAFPWASDSSGPPRDLAEDLAAIANDQSMRIIFSPVPAVLVRIEGEPVYQDVGRTGLQRIINTRALIVRDESGTHYLRVGGGWMEAYDLEGPWSIAGMAPDGAHTALTQALADHDVDLLDDASPAHLERGSARSVYVSTIPTALVVSDGDPQFGPVEGTSLLFATNTTSCVLRDGTDQELYVLVSSGWFRSWTRNGPWRHVPDAELPADLAAHRCQLSE